MRKYLIAGNWKMNTTISETSQIINSIVCHCGLDPQSPDYNKEIADKARNDEYSNPITVLLCPPFVNIPKATELIHRHCEQSVAIPDLNNSKSHSKEIATTSSRNDSSLNIKIGAQNCYFEKKGAFTGEISVEMLKEVGCSYVIVGHSERRAIFDETNELINKKLLAILSEDLIPILCIGETIEDRKSGNTFTVLEQQLNGCLLGIDNSDIDGVNSNIDKIVIAYEPVWAIGTGVSATAAEVAEAHKWLREFLVGKFGEKANDVYLLYGGSLSDANAEEVLSIKDVDGGLIGGASLVAERFLSIIKTALSIKN